MPVLQPQGFKQFDGDKDGTISCAELTEAVRQYTGMTTTAPSSSGETLEA